MKEYISGEDSLPVCHDLESKNWNETCFVQLNQEELEEENNDEGEEQVATQQSIKFYRDANKYLEEVQQFLEQRRQMEDNRKTLFHFLKFQDQNKIHSRFMA